MEIEGLVLTAIPYAERDHILTLFTPKAILKLFVKGKRYLDAHHQALISPFTIATYSYKEKKSDLHRFIEGKVVDLNLKLRDKLDSFEAAQKMVQAIYQTQWQNSETVALFHLIKLFLAQIPQTEEPNRLVAPFLIKLLKHEGVLDLSCYEDPRHIEALAQVRSFEALLTVLPDEKLAQEIEQSYRKVICPSVTST
ncbi:MAG: DNA repair protein RecO [Chlamydiales bacterium]|nr:DNA repair protein RecO [Chlamydiales bacterium]